MATSPPPQGANRRIIAYLHWQKSRGFAALAPSRKPASAVAHSEPPPRLVVLSAQALRPPEAELLGRMVQAMGLKPTDVELRLASATGPTPTAYLVLQCAATDSLREAIRAPTDAPVISTPHPGEMLRQPELKRTAWRELQRLMAILASAFPGQPA